MKFKISNFNYIFILFANSLFAQINNKIVLKIENEIITTFEIKNKILSSLVFQMKK